MLINTQWYGWRLGNPRACRRLGRVSGVTNRRDKATTNRTEGTEGGRGKALLFLDLGTRRCGWSAPRPGRFTTGKDPVPIVQEVGWIPKSVWTCGKNFATAGIRCSERPSRSQSLYRLNYLGPPTPKASTTNLKPPYVVLDCIPFSWQKAILLQIWKKLVW
jgi:hypothetical protein